MEVKWALERYYDVNLDERLTARQIGLALKVSQQTISRIMRGETWGHLSEPYLEQLRAKQQRELEEWRAKHLRGWPPA